MNQEELKTLKEILKRRGIGVDIPFAINNDNNEKFIISEKDNILILNNYPSYEPLSKDKFYIFYNILFNLCNISSCYEFTDEELIVLRLLYHNYYNYIARDENGTLYAFIEKPKKYYEKFWRVLKPNNTFLLNTNLFPNIEWINDEPFDIRNIKEIFEQ